MLRLRTAAIAALLVSALPANAAAQQFQIESGAFAGFVSRWTEGVEPADVDNDGDLDILFAEGDGFASPGTKRTNKLFINGGSFTFTNESSTRLGMSSNAKGVTAGDVDGDGWVDVLFANGFNTDTPFLYHNRGAAQPGFFDMESATRGFTEALSSASAQFGDLDDDGDLDVIINDSGNSFLGGAGGKARLYLNDGAGVFTEQPAMLNAPTKVAQMDVQLIDIDQDWDLDFFGVCRSSNGGVNHYLLLNDGNANFTDVSNLLPTTSSSVYEAEIGDLDNDGDLDIFYVSLSGFSEGVHRNNLAGGSLTFTAGSAFGGHDDNEIALIDFNNDGLLDPLVGSLGANREKLYQNNGGLSFSLTTAFQSITDSTLDLAIADLDNDGAYDVITAQGESGNFSNKVYKNTGAPDSLAPVITALDVPAAPPAWPVVVHAKMRDQVIDDGVTHVTSVAVYVDVDPSAQNVTHSGGVFSPAMLNVSVGTRVMFTNNDGSPQSVTSTTAPYGYDLALGAGGGSAEYVFVSPGVYDYASNGSGAMGQIVVSGVAHTTAGRISAGELYRYALPQIAGSECAVEFFFTDWVGNVSVSESQSFTCPGTCGSSVSFCNAAPNSVGAGALMGSNGAFSVSANSLVLTATGTPDQFGIFFYGATQLNGGAGVPFGNGTLCIDSPVSRLDIELASGNTLVHALDMTTPPTPGGQITGGSTWNFQAWYRDPAAGGSNVNLSDGLEITFCP